MNNIVHHLTFRSLSSEEIRAIYPYGTITKDEKRIFIMNTTFNLAETFLVASIINLFESKEEVETTATGWVSNGKENSFADLFKVCEILKGIFSLKIHFTYRILEAL